MLWILLIVRFCVTFLGHSLIFSDGYDQYFHVAACVSLFVPHVQRCSLVCGRNKECIYWHNVQCFKNTYELYDHCEGDLSLSFNRILYASHSIFVRHHATCARSHRILVAPSVVRRCGRRFAVEHELVSSPASSLCPKTLGIWHWVILKGIALTGLYYFSSSATLRWRTR